MNDQISNGADGRVPQNAQGEVKSLRQIAEETWDEVAETAGEPTGEDAPAAGELDEAGQPRDARGRFASKQPDEEPGEAAPDGTQPRQEHAPASAEDEPHPAPSQGEAAEAPANWSADDRQMFAKMPQEAKAFLLKRHSEMEGDYQRRVQANATAAQFTEALAPVFQDPVIASSLNEARVSPFEAITQWAGFHKRAMDPNPQVRMALWQELGQRMGLNPAATGQMSQPGQGPQLSEEDLKDPAIRYFADHLGRAFNDVQALRGELQQMRQQDTQRQETESVRAARWTINQFADERDAQGNLKRPYFDEVLEPMQQLLTANPQRDLAEVYETACWMVPAVREKVIAQRANAQSQKQAAAKAKQALRSNARGVTAPVAKPAAPNGDASGLRATLEASADEVGF